MGAQSNWSWSHTACIGLTLARCTNAVVVSLGLFVGLLRMGMEDFFDYSACTSYHFPFTGLPRPTLTWGFVPCLMEYFYILFSWYPWEACSVCREIEEQWIRGKRSGIRTWEQWRDKRLWLKCTVWEKFFKCLNEKELCMCLGQIKRLY